MMNKKFKKIAYNHTYTQAFKMTKTAFCIAAIETAAETYRNTQCSSKNKKISKANKSRTLVASVLNNLLL